MTMQPVDIPRIVYDTCELTRASVPKTVQVEVVTEPGIPILETNAAHMQQLVMNLVINAAEALGDSSGKVTVSTSLTQVTASSVSNILGYSLPSGDYLRLEVIDTGVGMDEATQAQIFDPFFTTKFTGRGLGLAAVHGIVRSLNGSIELSSAVGEGSRFTVLLPFRRVAEQAPPVTQMPNVRKSVILVIDDEEVVRKTAVTALRRAGHEVIEASGGRIGLELFEANRRKIGLILLDMSMPDMSGTETLVQLRRTTNVPVAIMSGYSEEEILDKFSGLKVSDFIPKPYSSRTLVEKVEGLLRTGGQSSGIVRNAASV